MKKNTLIKSWNDVKFEDVIKWIYYYYIEAGDVTVTVISGEKKEESIGRSLLLMKEYYGEKNPQMSLCRFSSFSRLTTRGELYNGRRNNS